MGVPPLLKGILGWFSMGHLQIVSRSPEKSARGVGDRYCDKDKKT